MRDELKICQHDSSLEETLLVCCSVTMVAFCAAVSMETGLERSVTLNVVENVKTGTLIQGRVN